MCGIYKMSIYTDLENSEISILNKDSQTIHAVFQFNKKLDLFKGHFPGKPILPGIFQIEMIKYVLEKSFAYRLQIKSVKKTKFSNLIHAEEIVMLDITIDEKNSLFNVKTILSSGNTIAGKINLVLTKFS